MNIAMKIYVIVRSLLRGCFYLIRTVWHTTTSSIRHPNLDVGFDCTVDSSCKFEGRNKIDSFSVVSRSSFGFGSYCGLRCQIRNANIGRFTSIADSVRIGLPEHDMRCVSTHPLLGSSHAPYITHIGSDVWIGSGAVVLGGVSSVGCGAVVGTDAVVTKDVPPYAIVAGVPAKIIGWRFGEDVIQDLKRMRWWDWPLDKILSLKAEFLDVKSFVTKYCL